MARTANTAKQGSGKRSSKKNENSNDKINYNKTTVNMPFRSFSVKTPEITQRKKPSEKSRSVKNYAVKEIQFYQNNIGFLIPKASMVRMFRYHANNMRKNLSGEGLRFTNNSVNILQEATENYLVCVLELAYMAARHAKRITLFPSDIRLVHRIKCYNL